MNPDPSHPEQALMAAFSDKVHSLAHAMLQAGPFVAEAHAPLRHELEAIAAEDRAAAERLERALEDREQVAMPGPPDPDVAGFNYLSIDHLAGVLREKLEARRGRYRQWADAASDDAEERQLLGELANQLDAQAARLDALLQPAERQGPAVSPDDQTPLGPGATRYVGMQNYPPEGQSPAT